MQTHVGAALPPLQSYFFAAVGAARDVQRRSEPRADGAFGCRALYHSQPFWTHIQRAAAERVRRRVAASIAEDDDVEGLFFVTSLPWLRYTQLVQPTAGGDESNPRISWGRYAADHRGRLMMPVTLLAHHALVDGLQLARFYRNLEEAIVALSSTQA